MGRHASAALRSQLGWTSRLSDYFVYSGPVLWSVAVRGNAIALTCLLRPGVLAVLLNCNPGSGLPTVMAVMLPDTSAHWIHTGVW